MIRPEDLNDVAFLEGLDEPDLQDLASASRERTVDGGGLIFEEGDEADGLYVVASGLVRVVGVDDGGAEVTLTTLGPGELFGELALLEGGRRSAAVRAVEASRLIVVERDAFLALVSRKPAVALRFLAALSRLVRERTERVLREEAARREVELQAEVDRHRTLSQMVAGVAHELNTPLGTANTAADIVVKRLASDALASLVDADPRARSAMEDAREAGELLVRNLARAHRLVMSFKQVSVQQSTARLETVDLGALLADIVELFRIDARQLGLEVTFVDERSDAERPWTGYPAYLTQVVLNLLGNVGRYAYPGPGGWATVTLAAATRDERPAFTVVVRDEGAGIAPEHLDRVFEPFFTTGRSRGGSGLGLAIVRNLVRDALAGTIQLESAVGAGTTVTVTIPAEPMAEIDAAPGTVAEAAHQEVAMA
jgi:signal transduction histidine kinase